MKYPFQEIESKWQKKWDDSNLYACKIDHQRPKFYALVEFPYPSGAGIHVGHPRSYTAMDVVCRKKRMEGFNVLFPMGWDAFGLPTENFAIKTGIHPKEATLKNVTNFKRQLKMLGLSFDWGREVDTTDPNYYKWTQWIFLELFKKGLAYKAEIPINWCPSCKVGLANEEVVSGKCERCESAVERKCKAQWMLKITAYADRLINDLESVNYLERIKTQQINWIGKSEGAEIHFTLNEVPEKLTIYTTRPDTLFGATYMVLSPEHPLLEKYQSKISNWSDVVEYQKKSLSKSDLERSELGQKKSGVEIKGITAINPLSNESIPVWISDYVLMSYGHGAIMAVPAHDDRDYEFAKVFNLPIREVISVGRTVGSSGGSIENSAYTDTKDGTLVNSGFLNGLSVNEAIPKILTYIEEKGLGKKAINYKLRDWVFSRQRYWGEPIPLVHCKNCGHVPLPEEELPLLLPEVERVTTSDDGTSILSKLSDWINTKCPKCQGTAVRESDTMPQWAGSSWYFLRYLDPHNNKELASKEAINYFMPVDWYNGGMEHTTLHLLYSRFWNKVLFDIGVVPTTEPYQKRTSHGMILGDDKEKMSKSRGNVINPDEIVKEFGADTFRMYEMFIGAFDQASAWNTQGVIGIHRFLMKLYGLLSKVPAGGQNVLLDDSLEKLEHRTIKEVTERINGMKFNTAVSSLMSFVNALSLLEEVPLKLMKTLSLLLHPFAPHLASEIFEKLFGGAEKHPHGIDFEKWPLFDPSKIEEDLITIGVQFLGKMRGTILIPAVASEEEVVETILKDDKLKKYVDNKTIKKVIYIKGKIVNIIL